MKNEFSTAHHVGDIGEENRHNKHSGEFGYGHVMFLRIRNLVEPVSRGMLVDNLDPDYPPLCFAYDLRRPALPRLERLPKRRHHLVTAPAQLAGPQSHPHDVRRQRGRELLEVRALEMVDRAHAAHRRSSL